MVEPLRVIRCRNGTVVRIFETWAETVLPGGQVVYATPQHTPEQAETARDLGYGDDVDAMTRDHDALHSALCDWLGLPASFSMMDAAGLLHEADRPKAWAEESAVLALQKLMVMAGVRVPDASSP